MTQQSALLIKTLEKIGAPLAAAVEEVSQRARGDMEPAAREVEDAKIIAQLLGQTVQISLSLGGSLIQASDEAEADALRLAVAAMIAPIIAHHYRQNGIAPDDNALSRITKSLEATLAFAENFNPASDQGSRLSILGEDVLVFDTAQVDITVLDALVPVVNAIGEFSFGLSETKLLQDVSEKIKDKAVAFNGEGDKLAELTIIKSLAKIYADCHLAEVRKLSNSKNEAGAELSIDPVWTAFDTRLAMVNILLGLAPVAETVPTGSVAPAQSAPVEAPPVTTPVAPVQPQSQPAVAPAAASAPTGGGGPMSFFSNKPAATAPEPVASAPQAAEPVQPAPTTPTTATVETQPAEASASGNPMSFFKPDAKEGKSETE